jgi:hypothetical protein
MKTRIAFLILSLSLSVYAQDPQAPGKAKDEKAPTLKSILLEQLQLTHNVKDWFAPGNAAVEGLTPEQASWKPKPDEHSVGQLTNHLVFWNQRSLAKFKGELRSEFNGKNDETFNSFDGKSWAAMVKQFDEVMTGWEKAVEGADEKKLEEWAPTISRIATHNAYHIGQIVLIRKLQGSWDPDKGVK